LRGCAPPAYPGKPVNAHHPVTGSDRRGDFSPGKMAGGGQRVNRPHRRQNGNRTTRCRHDPQRALHAVIDDGIEAARLDYGKPRDTLKREGAIAGFAASRRPRS
jgi:hypothetical protein